MAQSLFIETSWPPRILSPNAGRTRDIWNRKRAKDTARNEGFVATCAALSPQRDGPWGNGPPLGGGPFKVTIHAHPPTNRTRDDDNLVSSCKAMLDGVARRLKVDDSQFKLQPVQWHPAGRPGGLFIQIEVEP